MTRVFIGRDVDVTRETHRGVELTGRLRLRPGFIVDLVPVRPCREPSAVRRALVESWKIRSLGSDGPVYRGFCRWLGGGGHELPAADSDTAEVRGKQ